MAHELYTNAAGRTSMAFRGATPWHGLGQTMPAGASMEDWRSACGFDWSILKAQVCWCADKQQAHGRATIGGDFRLTSPGGTGAKPRKRSRIAMTCRGSSGTHPENNMPNLNDPKNFRGRVNYAAAVIAAGRTTTRGFDNCFENGDGSCVVAALVRRADRNPRLAKNIDKYLTNARETAARLSNIDDLSAQAELDRARAAAEFAAWMNKAA